MAKQLVRYICQQCENQEAKWYGQCPQCGAWNSFVESIIERSMRGTKGTKGTKRVMSKPKKLSAVRHIEKNRLKTKILEFDSVVGGGIVPGSVTLLSGDPGVGKSTLLLHVIAAIGGLYITGEESEEQVKLRAKRLGIKGDNIQILAETDVDNIIQVIRDPTTLKLLGASNPTNTVGRQQLVIIDSIQTLSSQDLSGMAGSVGQIRHSSERLIELAKAKSIPVIIVGHVTKTGTIAGPKILEHMVDTVLYLEGERFQAARILRTLKNRFGAIEEVGLFVMDESGLKQVQDASKVFLEDRVRGVPGSVVTVVMEGTRPVMVEIQALTVPSQLAMPRRVANGFDHNRLQLLLAILTKRLGVPLGSHDVFVNISGGFRVLERGVDLAVCMAILSSFNSVPIAAKTVAFGEVGLLGEVRRIASEKRRIKEAKKMGFTTMIHAGTVKQLKELRNIIKK